MNKTVPIAVYGCGGHGKVVCEGLLSLGLDVLGFLDDGTMRQKVMDLPVLGGWQWLTQPSRPVTVGVALGIGDAKIRHRIAMDVLALGLPLITVVHSKAVVGTKVRIGQGAVVMAGAVINPDAVIGQGAIVNTGAIVEHDCVLGDYAHLAPNAAMGGASSLGAFSQLGIGGVILPGVSIGDYSIAGAGAVVIRDLATKTIAVGVPARPK